MSCNRPEPITEVFFVPGDTAYTPGMSAYYEIVSYPLCRLYYDPNAKFVFQPWAVEWRKGDEPNYLSYLAKMGNTIEYITDRCLKGIKNGYFDTQPRSKYHVTQTIDNSRNITHINKYADTRISA